ncbi:hypothetical protein [Sorangium sp. So ce128]|uniref:hypothetical protein n=1 Tax=Sorangium sp. So ce128 TaxID=3133281 RepID=UPI003F6031B1
MTPSGWRKYRPAVRFVAKSLWICLVFGVVTGSAGSVRAEDPYPAPGKGGDSTVKDHLRRAKRARAQGQWTEAVAAYKAAFEAADPASATERERAEIAGELGLCELALRKYRDAAEHLGWSLEQGLEQHNALSPAQYERFSEGLRKATPFVVTLILAVDPPDAEVVVDGKSLGRTARTYRLFFEPGQHMVRGRAPGCKDALHTLRAGAGAEHDFTMPLLCAAPRSAKEAGSAKEAASTMPTPVRTLPAPRGQAPSPWASWPGTVRIGGIAVATAAVSTGAVLMIRASTLDGDASEQRDRLTRSRTSSSSMCWQASQRSACGDLRRLLDGRNLSDRWGTALVITGGVIGAATAASFFTDFSFLGASPAQERIHVSPVATGQETGVRIEGLW